MTFQGLLYAASYDHLDVPLMHRDNLSIVSLSTDLLEEVKDVLIPAEKLRIEDSKVIGKGNISRLFISSIYIFSKLQATACSTQVTLGQCTMDT